MFLAIILTLRACHHLHQALCGHQHRRLHAIAALAQALQAAAQALA